MIQVPDLHDAFVEAITVDWDKGTLSARFVSGAGEIVLTASGLRRFLMPREQPWGPSAYVNVASAAPVGHGTQLKIEMQSGDRWEIEAEAVQFEGSAAKDSD